MARTIWTGSLSFGLVTIPVGLYPATSDKSIHFNQLEEGTSDRIRYKRVNERTGEEVEASRIVRGVDMGGGVYVVVSDEELAAAEPERSRSVEITDFVDLRAIDPVYFRTTYYLAPQNEAGAKAYALLREAMSEAGKVAIATLVMRNKEYLVAIRPEQGVLALETMYFADEVRSPDEDLPRFAATGELSRREVDLAKMLVEAMSGEWVPDRYGDRHRQRVEELLQEKRQGREIARETEPGTPGRVVDLMEALEASVAATGTEGAGKAAQRAPGPAGGRTRSKRSPSQGSSEKRERSEKREKSENQDAAGRRSAKGSRGAAGGDEGASGGRGRAARAPGASGKKPGAPLRRVS